MENIVFIIIIITVVISYTAWKRPELFNKLLLWPYSVVHRKEYYRIITHGFIHADWAHLIVNMLVFWSFGTVLIRYFQYFWHGYAVLLFLLLYISAIVVSSIYSVIKHKGDYGYSAVGASGATSAIIFASMFFDPWNMIYFFGIIPIPGILFGVIYLIYSYKMAKRGTDNIGHDSHFWGAVYGFVFPLIFKPSLFGFFIQQLKNWPF
ncbi:MAG: rhomboid family intramembrane serine protease [Bacteroidales bacterium]|jgi:membrane associated rhomboid family serine protease|nr:rhomboid family intramembrane serine protease [Bacteroidales bacterium]